ncbi:MAG: MFS transporter [Opitutaceae bacterium]
MNSEEPAQSKTASRLWDPDFPVKPKSFPFFYGWIVVVFSTLGICASMPGQTVGFSVFKSRLSEALELSSMELSVAYMIGTLLSAVGLNAGGRYFDRSGARKAVVISLVSLGAVLIGLSFVEVISDAVAKLPFWGTATWMAPFLVLTVGFALLRFTGQGMVTLSSRAMMGKWFDKRRGAVTAWSGAILSFAFSGAPLVFEHLILSFGWQGAWQFLGAILILIFASTFWAFSRDNPEECGLEMDGGHVGKAQKENLDSKIYRDYTLSEARRTFSFWAFTLMFGLNGLVITAYTFHIFEVAAEMQVSNTYVLELFMPTAAVSVVSGFVLAWLTDQSFVRIKYLLCLMALSSAVGFATLGIGDYPKMSWLHIIGFGISGGCWGSLSTIVYPRFFGRAHLGKISGLFMTVIVVASAIGPVLFNCAEVYLGGYRAGFLITAVLALIIAIASFKAENPQRRIAN